MSACLVRTGAVRGVGLGVLKRGCSTLFPEQITAAEATSGW